MTSNPIRALTFLLTFYWTTTQAQNFQTKWENLKGPDGGSILQFDTDEDMLYALTYGGIYKSEDAGENWSLLQGSRNVADYFATFEAEAGILYVLTGSGSLSRSRDLGATWKNLLEKPYPIGIEGTLTGFFVLKDTLLALTSVGIYRSVDQGDTWNNTTVPGNFLAQNFKSFAKVGKDIFVAAGGTIFKSTNGGLNWVQNFVASFNFADMEAVDSVLYALYDGYPRLLRSYDGGIHWDKIDADSIKFGQYNNETRDWITGTGDKVFYSSDYWCVHGGVQMFRSIDQGEAWNTCPRVGLRYHYLHDVKALPEHLLAGTLQGVFRSQDDGLSFQPYHQGMNGASVMALFKTHNGRWWVNTRQGIFSSDDHGETWDLQFTGELEAPCERWSNSLVKTSGRLFRKECDLYCHVWMSEDGGNTWVEIPPIEPFWSADIYASGNALWVVEDSRLYRMADTENTFEEVPLPAQGIPYDLQIFVDKLAVSIEHNKYLSEDQGITWNIIPNQTLNSQQVGYPLYIDDHALFAISLPFEDTLLMFDLNQKTWKPYFPIVDGDTLKYWDFQFLNTTGALRWMAVNGRGLYYSPTAEPEKWYPFAPSLPFNSPTAIVFDQEDQEIWVGTAGAGIYKTKFQWETPVSPNLIFGIYPNPSKGKSTLSSPTFFTDKLTLRVFDVSGKLVREQVLPPGQSWDIRLDLPNALYLWQVVTAQGSVSLKWIKRN